MITTYPSGNMLIICFPKINDALCTIGPGLTLRSLIASSLSHMNATSDTAHDCRGTPIRSMSIKSRVAWVIDSKNDPELLHSSQGIPNSGMPNMKLVSMKNHFSANHKESSSFTAKV